jgi:hypothetical protein
VKQPALSSSIPLWNNPPFPHPALVKQSYFIICFLWGCLKKESFAHKALVAFNCRFKI